MQLGPPSPRDAAGATTAATRLPQLRHGKGAALHCHKPTLINLFQPSLPLPLLLLLLLPLLPSPSHRSVPSRVVTGRGLGTVTGG